MEGEPMSDATFYFVAILCMSSIWLCGFMMARNFYIGKVRRLQAQMALDRILSNARRDLGNVPRAQFLRRHHIGGNGEKS